MLIIDKRRRQGIDTCTFKIITDKAACGILKNQTGTTIAELRQKRNNMELIVCLPRAVRPNNITPFQSADFLMLDEIVCEIKTWVRDILDIDRIDSKLTKTEVNLTAEAYGAATCDNINKLLVYSHLGEKEQVRLYAVAAEKNRLKPCISGVDTFSVKNEYVLKCYDKGKKEGLIGSGKKNLELQRIEFVLQQRYIDRIFKGNASIDTVLSEDGCRALIKAYAEIYEKMLRDKIYPYIENTEKAIFKYLAKKGRPIDAYSEFKDIIHDKKIFAGALKMYYNRKGTADNSRQVIGYIDGKFSLPKDTIKTLQMFKELSKM